MQLRDWKGKTPSSSLGSSRTGNERPPPFGHVVVPTLLFRVRLVGECGSLNLQRPCWGDDRQADILKLPLSYHSITTPPPPPSSSSRLFIFVRQLKKNTVWSRRKAKLTQMHSAKLTCEGGCVGCIPAQENTRCYGSHHCREMTKWKLFAWLINSLQL